MSQRSQIWRAPLQGGGRWQYEGTAQITHGPWIGKSQDGSIRSGVAIRGAIASGRGNSKIVVQIAPEDFAELAQVMCAANREAAILAFSAAIVESIADETPDR